MISDARLKVEFDSPENGWTTVKLSAGDSCYQFFPSYIPYDSFSELVDSLLKILDGYSEAVVRWNDEPVEHRFVFTSEADTVTFKVYEVIDSAVTGKTADEKFAFRDFGYKILRPFWRALRHMQMRQDLNEYEKQWGRPFPVREMFELTGRIKATKNNAY